jgi:integrase
MPQIHLTKSSVDAIEATPGKHVLYWDTKLIGFGIRVSKTGVKVYVVQYRTGEGRRGVARRATIGRHGKLTPDEARKAAKSLLGQAANGEDPANKRAAKRKEMTVAELIDWYAESGAHTMKPTAAGNKVRGLRYHVVPLLGHKLVSNVDSDDIVTLITHIKAGKTACDFVAGPRRRIIVRGGEGAARKVARDLSSVFTYAIKKKKLPANPCHGVDKGQDIKRTRYLETDEIQRAGAALDQLAAAGQNPKGLAIIRLWMLTGGRRNEIAGLKWSEINFATGALMLTDTKTGASHRPLSLPAMDILRSITRGDSPFVFPAESGDSFYTNARDLWEKVCKLAQIHDATPHTLRHTFGSHGASSGLSLPVVAGILGHKDIRSTMRYAHLQPHVARDAADQVAAKLAAAMSSRIQA